MAAQVARAHRFTTDEFERMVVAGTRRPDEGLEPVPDAIVGLTPHGHRHGVCGASLTTRLVTGVGDRAVVWIQGSARQAFPEPELTLLRPRSDATGAPASGDILRVPSQRDARTEGRGPDGGAGLPEYWGGSLGDPWIEVDRLPQGAGLRECRRAACAGTIAPRAVSTIAVADVFA